MSSHYRCCCGEGDPSCCATKNCWYENPASFTLDWTFRVEYWNCCNPGGNYVKGQDQTVTHSQTVTPVIVSGHECDNYSAESTKDFDWVRELCSSTLTDDATAWVSILLNNGGLVVQYTDGLSGTIGSGSFTFTPPQCCEFSIHSTKTINMECPAGTVRPALVFTLDLTVTAISGCHQCGQFLRGWGEEEGGEGMRAAEVMARGGERLLNERRPERALVN